MYARGSITKWSRLAGVCALVALVVPDGAYRWTALSLAAVALVLASTRVPREAWAAHRLLLASLGCVVAAIWAAELLPLGADAAAWTVGVTGAVFVGVIVSGAVRLIREGRNSPP